MPTTLPAVRRCSFDELGAMPDLFVDYCTDFDALADHYAGDWRDDDARRAAADAAAARTIDRDVLADVLAEQNERWGAGARAMENVEALRDPETVAVVTGQQVGLFTGPLYTTYKTITTLKVAEELADLTGRTVVPVFWVEGEDHDFDEIAGTHVLRRNELAALRYTGHAESDAPAGGNLGAVGRLPLTEQITDVLDRVDEIFPPSDFKPEVMRRLREAYRPGTPIEDAFARLMRSLFEGEGLVFVNPDDARLKGMSAPLFRREITDPEPSSARVREAGEQLVDAGYHAQVHTRPTNLFLLDDTGRHPIDRAGDGEGDGEFVLRDDGRTFTEAELLDRLDASPEAFSPNVVLRPLMQDAILPTATYVAGPSEVSYFAQYKGVYEWAEMDMPLIHPRASVSLVESKVEKVLEKYDLTICRFDEQLDRLFQDVVVQEMEVDVDAMFDDAMTPIHKTINELKAQIEEVDATLGRSAEATRASLIEAMNELKHKVVRAEKRQKEEVRTQLEKAHANLRPGGALQERTVNVAYYLNKYSVDLIANLRDVLSTDTSSHQVVSL
jgi:bacillithiol biosynthesis cysteine-adding enzyme BshC